VNYAKRWGYGSLLLANLFSFRSTDPNNLYAAEDPVGPDADVHLKSILAKAQLVICCWTSRGRMGGRDLDVYKMIKEPHCLAVLSDGSPGHPLYKSASLKPIRYQRKAEQD
jgi:hypothetical protein